MANMQMKKVDLTYHAKQRMAERMPDIQQKDYEKIAQSARYKGKTKYDLLKENPKFANAIFQRFKANNSTEVRVYKDHVFIFCGPFLKKRSTPPKTFMESVFLTKFFANSPFSNGGTSPGTVANRRKGTADSILVPPPKMLTKSSSAEGGL